MPIDPVSVFLALTAAAIFTEDDQEQRRAISFVTFRANEAGPSWVDALDRRFALVDIVFDDLWLEEAGRGGEVGVGWRSAIVALGEDGARELFRRLLDRYRLIGTMVTGEEDEPSGQIEARPVPPRLEVDREERVPAELLSMRLESIGVEVPGGEITERSVSNVVEKAGERGVVGKAVQALLLAGVPPEMIFVAKFVARYHEMLFYPTIFDLLPDRWKRALREAIDADAGHDAELLKDFLGRWGIQID